MVSSYVKVFELRKEQASRSRNIMLHYCGQLF